MVQLLRHRQPKGSETDRLHLTHRVTPRLHKLEIRMEGLVTTVSAEVGCQSEELVVVAVESQSRVGVLAQTYVRRVHQEKSDVEKGHRSYRCRSDKGLEFPARLHQKSNGLNCRPSEHRSVSLSLVADQLFSTLEFRSLRQCEACPAHELA